MWVDLDSPAEEIVAEAVHVIRSGGIVFYPSDTIYGLGCDPFDDEALKRLYRLKGRNEGKGVLLLVPNREWVRRLVADVPLVADRLMDSLWPGPLTLLLPASRQVPSGLCGKEGKIGVRCPDSKFLQEWMNSLCGPVVSTSANLSGQGVPNNLEALRDLFLNRVDLFLEAGELAGYPPSTVLDLVGRPKVVRRGARVKQVTEILDSLSGGNDKRIGT